jgi:hypothetical protein
MENPISFHETVKDFKTVYDQNIGLLLNLLQIYLPLNCLKNKFTHNDLHSNNVLLYKIPNDNYIQITYILPNGYEITFKTDCILKIIDYGRAFFHENINLNSVKFYEQLDSLEDCDAKNQFENGYAFRDKISEKKNHFISTLVNNISKDLWLLQIVRIYVEKWYITGPELPKTAISHAIKINILNKLTKVDYGGPEILDKDCKSNVDEEGQKDPCNINIVSNILIDIFTLHKDYISKIQNDHYKKSKKIANMKVYLDLSKEMEYEPVNEDTPKKKKDAHATMDISDAHAPMKKKKAHTPMDISEPVFEDEPMKKKDAHTPMDTTGGSSKNKCKTKNVFKSKKKYKYKKKCHSKKHIKTNKIHQFIHQIN